jgi:hypothetical protein
MKRVTFLRGSDKIDLRFLREVSEFCCNGRCREVQNRKELFNKPSIATIK